MKGATGPSSGQGNTAPADALADACLSEMTKGAASIAARKHRIFGPPNASPTGHPIGGTDATGRCSPLIDAINSIISPTDPTGSTDNAGLIGPGKVSGSQKPIPIKPNFQNIPAQLQSKHNWVLWRYLPPKSKGGKWRKVPFQPNGKTADTTDRSTWSAFDECCAAYVRGGFDGVGFAFDAEIGADGLCYCGVDFDGCIIDGKVQSLALERINALDTYTERSPSGTGFHCIVCAEPLDRPAKYDGVEVYTQARYFTFTGIAFGEIKAAPTEVRSLVHEVHAKEALAKHPRTGQSGFKGISSIEFPNCFKNVKPPRLLVSLDPDNDNLSDGIRTNWFADLSPQQKDEVVDYALGSIAKHTRLLELEANGGNNAEYYRLTTSIARSGAPNAQDLFVKHASTAINADPSEALQQHFSRCRASEPSGAREISVGTLIRLAQQNGANFDQWTNAAGQNNQSETNTGAATAGDRAATANSILAQMNRDYSAGSIEGKFRVLRWMPDARYPAQRTCEFQTKNDFCNSTVNPKVEVPKFDKKGNQVGTEPKGRGAWWLGQDTRSEFDGIDFRPGAPAIIERPTSYGDILKIVNMCSGFSCEPSDAGEDGCSLYLGHVRDNICGGDAELYNYSLDWMASGVQHPENPARSALSLRGDPGCGKGVFVLGYGRLFGRHFLHATQRDHVTGKFNSHQAETCLIFVDEALYAQIKSDAQILKTLTTETTKLLERKGIDAIQIDNYARLIFATNDPHPIMVEHNDRRYVAIYVRTHPAWAGLPDKEAAPIRKAYFQPIIDQMNNGGREALLGLLFKRDISEFNAEAIPQTKEREHQKLLSAPLGDKIVIGYAQEGQLPCSDDRRDAARPYRDQRRQEGLYPAMKQSGGKALQYASDAEHADILKNWGFQRTRDRYGTLWVAPPLAQLRANIAKKYPAIEWDNIISEWGQETLDPPPPPPAGPQSQLPQQAMEANERDWGTINKAGI